MNPRNLIFVGTLLVWLAADQASKFWVQSTLAYRHDAIDIIPNYFSLIHAQNTGAAFSSFEGQIYLFLAMTAIAAIALPWFVLQQPKESRFIPMVSGMLLSGALGNGIDRLRQGHVVDFLNVYVGAPPEWKRWCIDTFGTYIYPTFNVADIALVVGVILYLVHSMFFADSEAPSEAPQAEGGPQSAPPVAADE